MIKSSNLIGISTKGAEMGLILVFATLFVTPSLQFLLPTGALVAISAKVRAELYAELWQSLNQSSAEGKGQFQTVGSNADDGTGRTNMTRKNHLFPRRLSQDRLERLKVLAGQLGQDQAGMLNPLTLNDYFPVAPTLKFMWMREWPEFADHSDLLLAVLVGDDARAKKLLLTGSDPNGRTRDGTTALMYSSEQGNLEMVRALLEADADPNARKTNGETALLLAAHRGNFDEAMSLIDYGADVQAGRTDGFTALMAGANSGSVSLVRLLLDRGANARAITADHWTSLMYASGKNAGEIAKILIENGAVVNAQPASDGSTALLVAASRRAPSLLRILLGHGADVNERNARGKTALMLVTADEDELAPGDITCVRILLNAGADPNLTDASGWTALMNSAKYGTTTVAEALLKRGAKVDKRNDLGQSALSIAIQEGQQDVAGILRNAGAVD